MNFFDNEELFFYNFITLHLPAVGLILLPNAVISLCCCVVTAGSGHKYEYSRISSSSPLLLFHSLHKNCVNVVGAKLEVFSHWPKFYLPPLTCVTPQFYLFFLAQPCTGIFFVCLALRVCASAKTFPRFLINTRDEPAKLRNTLCETNCFGWLHKLQFTHFILHLPLYIDRIKTLSSKQASQHASDYTPLLWTPYQAVKLSDILWGHR